VNGERGLAVVRAAYFLSLAALAAFVAYLEVRKIHWPLDETSVIPLLVVVLSAMSGVCFVCLSTLEWSSVT
jgi:hypothetical protein